MVLLKGPSMSRISLGGGGEDHCTRDMYKRRSMLSLKGSMLAMGVGVAYLVAFFALTSSPWPHSGPKSAFDGVGDSTRGLSASISGGTTAKNVPRLAFLTGTEAPSTFEPTNITYWEAVGWMAVPGLLIFVFSTIGMIAYFFFNVCKVVCKCCCFCCKSKNKKKKKLYSSAARRNLMIAIVVVAVIGVVGCSLGYTGTAGVSEGLWDTMQGILDSLSDLLGEVSVIVSSVTNANSLLPPGISPVDVSVLSSFLDQGLSAITDGQGYKDAGQEYESLRVALFNIFFSLGMITMVCGAIAAIIKFLKLFKVTVLLCFLSLIAMGFTLFTHLPLSIIFGDSCAAMNSKLGEEPPAEVGDDPVSYFLNCGIENTAVEVVSSFTSVQTAVEASVNSVFDSKDLSDSTTTAKCETHCVVSDTYGTDTYYDCCITHLETEIPDSHILPALVAAREAAVAGCNSMKAFLPAIATLESLAKCVWLEGLLDNVSENFCGGLLSNLDLVVFGSLVAVIGLMLMLSLSVKAQKQLDKNNSAVYVDKQREEEMAAASKARRSKAGAAPRSSSTPTPKPAF